MANDCPEAAVTPTENKASQRYRHDDRKQTWPPAVCLCEGNAALTADTCHMRRQDVGTPQSPSAGRDFLLLLHDTFTPSPGLLVIPSIPEQPP